mmetsp:Transcript_59048/g.113892  ORF Transcript_59048/g.113892 Transcript_59048/m.113892 type:complete len:254 (-) Transcript_59048:8-769(-)
MPSWQARTFFRTPPSFGRTSSPESSSRASPVLIRRSKVQLPRSDMSVMAMGSLHLQIAELNLATVRPSSLRICNQPMASWPHVTPRTRSSEPWPTSRGPLNNSSNSPASSVRIAWLSTVSPVCSGFAVVHKKKGFSVGVRSEVPDTPRTVAHPIPPSHTARHRTLSEELLSSFSGCPRTSRTSPTSKFRIFFAETTSSLSVNAICRFTLKKVDSAQLNVRRVKPQGAKCLSANFTLSSGRSRSHLPLWKNSCS